MCKTENSGSCSCDSKKKNGAYFYVEFLGIKEREIDTKELFGDNSNDSGEDWKKSLGEDNKSPFGDLPKKFKIPDGDVYGTAIFSESGLFVPSAIVDYLKTSFDVDKVSFQLIHRMTAEEYQAEVDYQQSREQYKEMYKKAEDALKKRLENGTKTPSDMMRENKLPYHVNDEIQNLIGSVESGKLHVIGPDANEPDFEKPPSDDDLGLGGFKFDDEEE
jgi:hypothetical protein